jgi:hypothetical protein
MVVDMEMNRRAALVLDACSVDWMYQSTQSFSECQSFMKFFSGFFGLAKHRVYFK